MVRGAVRRPSAMSTAARARAREEPVAARGAPAARQGVVVVAQRAQAPAQTEPPGHALEAQFPERIERLRP